MAIIHKCPQCSEQFRLRDELVGKRIKCPKCATPQMVGAQAAHTPARPKLSPKLSQPAAKRPGLPVPVSRAVASSTTSTGASANTPPSKPLDTSAITSKARLLQA